MLNLLGQHSTTLIRRVDDTEWPEEVAVRGKVIPPGLSLIHFIIWKFIIIHMTLLSISGMPFIVDNIISQAKKRIKRKIEGATVGLRCKVLAAEAKGREPKVPAYHKWVRGIGHIQDNRKLVLKKELQEWLDQ